MPVASFCSCAAQFVSTLVENPEDMFPRDEDHLTANVMLCPLSGKNAIVTLLQDLCIRNSILKKMSCAKEFVRQ